MQAYLLTAVLGFTLLGGYLCGIFFDAARADANTIGLHMRRLGVSDCEIYIVAFSYMCLPSNYFVDNRQNLDVNPS